MTEKDVRTKTTLSLLSSSLSGQDPRNIRSLHANNSVRLHFTYNGNRHILLCSIFFFFKENSLSLLPLSFILHLIIMIIAFPDLKNPKRHTHILFWIIHLFPYLQFLIFNIFYLEKIPLFLSARVHTWHDMTRIFFLCVACGILKKRVKQHHKN